MGGRVHKPTILIVDDDRAVRNLLSRIFQLEGFEVHTAANGLKFLSILKVNRPDVILLDIMMDWVDGYELCRIVKRTETYRHIPILFVTGKTAKADIERGYEVGGSDYVTKPFDNQDIVRRVHAQLDMVSSDREKPALDRDGDPRPAIAHSVTADD